MGGCCLVISLQQFWWEILEENAISDILEPHAFQKYSIHWVLEALCICFCLCLCVFVFLHVFVLVIVITG